MKTNTPKLIIISLLATGLFFTSCEEMWDQHIDGNGERRSENRDLQEFSRIQVNGEFEVQIDTGNNSSALIVADENLMDLIETSVSGNLLIIEPRQGVNLHPSHTIEIVVTTRVLDEITLNGSGFVYCYGLITDAFTVNLAGSGNIECFGIEASAADYELEGSGVITSNLFVENLYALIEGSGEIRLSGTSITADYKVIGSGKIKAGQMESDVCAAYITGSGTADAKVNDALEATITGSGIVYYSGNPHVDTHINGSGRVIKR